MHKTQAMSYLMRHHIGNALTKEFLRNLHTSYSRISCRSLYKQPFLKKLYNIVINVD
jgi:hypothetical protein